MSGRGALQLQYIAFKIRGDVAVDLMLGLALKADGWEAQDGRKFIITGYSSL